MFALVLLVVSGALPFRIWSSLGLFRSYSVLDVVVVGLAFWLGQRALRGRAISVGDPWVFQWLCMLPAAAALSILWTTSIQETLRSVVVYAEGIVAYLCACTALSGRSERDALSVAALFVVLLLMAAVLMLVLVPGFEPQRVDDPVELASYYSRLSHPFLGKSNNLAGLLAFFVFPFAGWAWSRRSTWYSTLAVLTALALVLTLSRGVILAVAATLFIAGLGSGTAFRRGALVVAIAGPVVAFLLAVIIATEPIAADYIGDRLSIANVVSRGQILDAALEDLDERPLLGFGAGAVGEFDDRLSQGAHNTYLEQMLAFGIPLGAVASLSLVMVFLRLRRLANRRGVRDWRNTLWLAALCEALIFLTETSFEGSILRILFYMSIGWASILLAVRHGDIEGQEAVW